jgi:predicted RNA-binding protein YlxR (DUF448 family)
VAELGSTPGTGEAVELTVTGRRTPRVVPVRMCVGCKARASVSDLVRVTVVEVGGVRSVLPDHRRRLPGRGASLHPAPGCLDLAERRRAFPRALRSAGPLDTEALRSWITGTDHRTPTETGSGSNNAMSAR